MAPRVGFFGEDHGGWHNGTGKASMRDTGREEEKRRRGTRTEVLMWKRTEGTRVLEVYGWREQGRVCTSP
jgi:hypothetical protein